MKRTILGAAVTLALMQASASAEPLRLAQNAPGVLPPYEVMTILRSTGLNPLHQPQRRGMTYVVRALSASGEEFRVTVDARYGDIMAAVPVEDTARAAPPASRRPGTTLGPYEPVSPDGYLAPPRLPGPDIDDDDDLPTYAPRYGAPLPPATIPSAPVPRTQATAPITPSPLPPPGASTNAPATTSALGDPYVITAPEPGQGGLLPPPPERFPQRVAPAAPSPAPKPAAKKPPERAASAVPAQTPLPKPRPASAQPAPSPAAAPAQPVAPQNKPADNAVPH